MDKARLSFQQAAAGEAAQLAALHTAVAGQLTELHGQGAWSSKASEKGLLHAMRHREELLLTAGRDSVEH